MAQLDPAHAAELRAGGVAYSARLQELDRWVREQIATIPPENRKLVSFHEAFPYFANAYGLEIVGSVVGVPGQDPSAGEVAALVDAIRASGAKAVFTEAQFNPELARGDRGRSGRRGRERPVQRLARRPAGRHLRGPDPLGRRADRGRAPVAGLGSPP